MAEREFDGKLAFITGAAHGQGRATALALAKAGACIAAFDVARQLAYPGYALGSQDDSAALRPNALRRARNASRLRGMCGMTRRSRERLTRP